MVFVVVLACGLALAAVMIALAARREVARLGRQIEGRAPVAAPVAVPYGSLTSPPSAPAPTSMPASVLASMPAPASASMSAPASASMPVPALALMSAASAAPPVHAAPALHAVPAPPAVPAPLLAPVAQRTSAPAPAKPSVSLEERLGKHGGAWAGAIALLGAGGYYLRLASGHGRLGGGGKVGIALALAVIALLLGERFARRGARVLGHGLLGVGFGVGFGALFAGYARYDLYSAQLAMVLLTTVTVIGLTLAVRRDAPTVAVLAVLGGYLTPALAGRASDVGTPLCLYLTLLDVGVLGVALARRWRALEWLSFVGTWALFVGWYHRADAPDPAITLAWAAWFVALFMAVPLVQAVRRGMGVTTARLWLLGASGVVGFGFAVDVLARQRSMAVAAAIVALGYAIVSWVMARWLRGDGRARAWTVVLAASFAALAIPLAQEGRVVSIGWALEAPVLMALGAHFRLAMVRRFGSVVLVAAVAWLVAHAWPFHDGAFVPFANRAFATAIAVALAAAAFARLAGAVAARDGDPHDRWLVGLATVLAAAVVLGAIDRELWSILDGRGPAAATASAAWWLAVTLGLTIRGHERGATRGAMVTLAVAAIPTVMMLTHEVTGVPFANIRFALAAGGSILAIALGVLRHRRESGAGDVLWALGGAALFALVSREAWAQAIVRASEPERAHWVAHTALSCAWSVSAAVILAIGFARRHAGLRYLGLALFAVTVAKVVLFDLRSLAGGYRVGSLVVVGALLLSASWLYHRRGEARTE